MTVFSQRTGVGALLATVAALVLFACGGGDGGGEELTLEEYLGMYEEIDNRAEAASDELDTRYASVLEQPQLTDANRPDVQAYFEELIDVGQTYVDELSELEPPEEAQEIHEASIASYQRVLDLYDEAQQGIGQATSIGELNALFGTADINEALDQANADCAALQQLANDNSVAVDFACQTAEEGADSD